MTKIIQYTHRPNNTELGKGNTHETYLLIGKDYDLSDLFPDGKDVNLTAVDRESIYTVRAAIGREFRINQFGPLYRDYGVCEGDEIVITIVDNGETRNYAIRVNVYNRIILSQKNMGCEIGNIERLSSFGDKTNGYELNAIKDGISGVVDIIFDGAKPKRTDSPDLTDFYTVTFNGNKLENGNYYFDLNDTTIGRLEKSQFNEIILDGENINSSTIDSSKECKTSLNQNSQPHQQIYYGAPGTGKSHSINEITEKMPIENVFRTTFHPDSDYSTFVGCYKPTQVKKAVRNVAGDVVKAEGQEVYENTIQYEFVPQAFLKAYKRAYETDESIVLVIEEINRGNCAQIFGDLFQLLDRKDGVSEYPIDADEDLRKYLIDTLGEDSPAIANGKLCLPANLYIWATMNTSDQSLFPIDSAFKRRWEWKYTRIAQGKKEDGTLEHWKLENDTDWWDFLKKINAIIDDMTQSADKQLGYYFCKPDKENDTISYARFVNKVLFYLWNDIFKTFSTDEYEQLFKIKRLKTDADGKWIEPHELEDKESKLTFPELYDEKGDVIPEIAKQFIEKVIAWGGKPTTENA